MLIECRTVHLLSISRRSLCTVKDKKICFVLLLPLADDDDDGDVVDVDDDADVVDIHVGDVDNVIVVIDNNDQELHKWDWREHFVKHAGVFSTLVFIPCDRK